MATNLEKHIYRDAYHALKRLLVCIYHPPKKHTPGYVTIRERKSRRASVTGGCAVCDTQAEQIWEEGGWSPAVQGKARHWAKP